MAKYNHIEIEKKWQKYWAKHPELYLAKEKSQAEKQYILDMFPYPSADGLHAGHVESYTATDIVSRYWRMKGKNVLHPQGWDAFGLPAENYAIKTKTHPAITTERAIKNFKRQMNMMGLSYDWSREVKSSDPEYYKWTQWFFLLLYKNGLAYKGKAKVNWCPNCQTVLANEQAEGGVCERCGSSVVQKDLEQWFFKITDFIEPSYAKASEGQGQKTSGLLDGLDKIDWPESTKAAQKNWIGKSEGAEFEMEIVGTDKRLEVYTTRLDTVFGMTFALIAPEHEMVQRLKPQITNWGEVEKYISETKKKSELQRLAGWEKVPPQSGEDARNSNSASGGENFGKKTGVELKGIKVINPFTKQEIPLFASDFVLAHYGTGAVMAVPGHDQRDYEFAKKYKLPIEFVIARSEATKQSPANAGNGLGQAERSLADARDDKAFIEDGVLINSGDYNGLTSAQAREKMTRWFEKEGIGKRTINYKIRDWLISRQRYWGAPIPIIYCPNPNCHSRPESVIPAKAGIQFGVNSSGNPESGSRVKPGMTEYGISIIDGKKYAMVPVPEKDLPVLLPTDVDFMPHGESPLARSKSFHDIKCPVCDGKARRESDTMDTFVCSSWYYFRYPSARSTRSGQVAFDPALTRNGCRLICMWAARNMLFCIFYTRFFTKVLHKLGYIDFDEPFAKMRHQGIILAEDGKKMSKSLSNVVNPDDVVAQYGADALRMFEMFMGPLEDMKAWNTKGIVGISRFLERIWKLKSKLQIPNDKQNPKSKFQNVNPSKTRNPARMREIESLLHKTIKKVSEDIENLRFNTAISALMILANEFGKEKEISLIYYSKFLILLSPFAPHITEELWNQLGNKKSIFTEKWPEYDPKLVKDETIELVVQINGKVRAKLSVPAEISEEEAKNLATSDVAIKKWLAGKEPKKVIFVKGRLINIVV